MKKGLILVIGILGEEGGPICGHLLYDGLDGIRIEEVIVAVRRIAVCAVIFCIRSSLLFQQS